MTRQEIAERIAQEDPTQTVASRIAELVAEGCDYDEQAQKLTDAYAEWVGVSEEEEDDYEVVREIANEHLTAELS